MGSKILRDLYPEHESIGGHWWILKKTRARVHGRPHKGLGPGPSKLQDPRNSGSKMTLFICCGSQGFSSWFSISVYQLSLLFSLFFPVYFHVGQTRPHLFLCTTEMKPQISASWQPKTLMMNPAIFLCGFCNLRTNSYYVFKYESSSYLCPIMMRVLSFSFYFNY